MSGQTNPAFTDEEPKKENNISPSFTSKEDLIKDYGSVELGVLSNDEKVSQDYDPYLHRKVAHPTTDAETMLHFLKGSLGTGILSMPLAFLHSGYAVGVVVTIVIGAICTHCIRTLIQTGYEICKKRKIPSITYPLLAEAALEEGPPILQKCSSASVHVVKVLLLIFQLGIGCVYTVFIADNIKNVFDQYDMVYDVKIYMVAILVPLILINYIQNLKILAPFSTVANCLTWLTFGIILYYLFQNEITFKGREPVGTAAQFPLFFGTVLFALEAIGVMLPLENEMKNPKSFMKTFGVLNVGMWISVFLYVGMGLLGYLAYGPKTAPTVTLNIGSSILAQTAKVLLALSIYVSHALQNYVAIDILWNQYILAKYEKLKHQLFWEYLVRTSTVLVTFCLAVAVPKLDLFISLFGALCLSVLGLAVPALLQTSFYWKTAKGPSARFMFFKNYVLMIFGFVGLVVGTYTSLKAIVDSFNEEK